MPYSNPVIKEIIRERLMSMVVTRLNEEQKALVMTQLNEIASNRTLQFPPPPPPSYKIPGIYKWGGAIGAGVIQGVDSADAEWKQNKEKGLDDSTNTTKTVIRGGVGAAGAAGGAWAGIKAGAAGGAALGAGFAGVGAVPGAIIGAIGLGLLGAWAGGALGDSVGDKITNIGEDPAAQKKAKEDATKAEGDQRQKDADDRWAPKYGSSNDKGFGRPPKGGYGARSSRTSYQNLAGRGQSQEFSIGGAGSVDFSASQTQWDNSNYNGSGADDKGEASSPTSKSSNGVTRYPTPGIDLSEPITSDSLGPAKKDLVAAAGAGSEEDLDAIRKGTSSGKPKSSRAGGRLMTPEPGTM